MGARTRVRSAREARGGELWNSARARGVARPPTPGSRRDERLERAGLVRTGPPEHVLKRVHGFSRSGGSLRNLAGPQGPLARGGLPRAEGRVLPAGLAQRHLRRLDRDVRLDGRPDRVLARAGDDFGDPGPVRPGLLRSVQSLLRWRTPLLPLEF